MLVLSKSDGRRFWSIEAETVVAILCCVVGVLCVAVCCVVVVTGACGGAAGVLVVGGISVCEMSACGVTAGVSDACDETMGVVLVCDGAAVVLVACGVTVAVVMDDTGKDDVTFVEVFMGAGVSRWLEICWCTCWMALFFCWM